MIKLYFGGDTISVRLAAMAAIAGKAEAGDRVERVEKESWNAGLISEMIGSTSLFGDNTTYFIDTPSDDSDFYDLLIKSLSELKTSSNTLIIVEGILLAPEKKKWSKEATVIEEFAAVPANNRFDVFSLAEALSNKDKKSLWLLLTKAKLASLSAEEIIGTLWWQLKTLRIAAITNSAEEAGMKSYPYDKAKRALRNFKSGELESLSRNLLRVYHDGHSGVKDIDLGLEEWVLTV